MLKLVGGEQKESNEELKYPEHDLLFKGHKLHLRIEATACGFDVEYFAILKHKTPFGEIETRPVAMGEHIHPKWWWKLIFRTPERQIEKAVAKMKYEVKSVLEAQQTISKLSLK